MVDKRSKPSSESARTDKSARAGESKPVVSTTMHYLLLSSVLRAFAEDLKNGAVTLPFDTGKAHATFEQGADLRVKIECEGRVVGLMITDTRGRPVGEAVQPSGGSYVLPPLPTDAELLLRAETAE